jgi:hypothetical protein
MLHLNHCAIEWVVCGARVVFPNGAETTAWPHPKDSHYHVISHRLGYGDDLLAYCREHELAHIVVAEQFSGTPSCVLWAQANRLTVDPGAAMLEEIAAQTLQRWVRTNERPILAGCDWDALKARFLGYVAQLEGTA